MGSAVHQRPPAGKRELVALGVATDVVVIVENENARLRPLRPVEMRRRKPADAAADNDQVIVFAGRRHRTGAPPEVAVAQRMRGLETAWMIAPQPGQRRWIIVRRILCGGLCGRRGDEARQRRAGRSAANGERNAVEKVPSCNRGVHRAVHLAI